MLFCHRLGIERRLVIVANSIDVFFFLQIQIVVNVFILSEVNSLILIDIIINVFFDVRNLTSQN